MVTVSPKTMTLQDYIGGLSTEATTEKNIQIKKIATACKVSVSTVYRWISGKVTPDHLKKEKIAEITGLPIEELFPEDKVSN